jgi:hypothetical protein
MFFSGSLVMTSCEDYLDKAPESTVSADDAFKNFRNFQGFTEELYYCIPDFAHGYWNNSFNWGEDEIMSFGVDYHMGYKVDMGDFWGWQSNFDGWGSGWMDRGNTKANSTDRFQKSLWPLAWYGIRKANLGLENLDKMIECTDEERNLITGQLYFFRAWFHFELMQYFGGLPYISSVPSASEPLRNPRLKYQECADLAAEDFRRAADLLPINWDNTNAGKTTFGNNQLRINKIMALGFLAKNYLWAGSPLMNYASQGSKSYNADYCKKAADVFAELLKLVDGGQTQYALADFSKYSDIFYSYKQNFMNPGSTEAIFQTPMYDAWMGSGWSLGPQFVSSIHGGEINGVVYCPTANYVNYYGMANGLPLNDAASGFNAEYPWRNRDPRFYHDIIFDGLQVVQNTSSAEAKAAQFANLHTGGNFRDNTNNSRTGYLLRKFTPLSVNKYDEGIRDYGDGLTIQVSWLRLADVYLMYAEAAANGYGTPQSKANGYELSAVDAVNKIRTRAGIANIAGKFTGSVESFMSELRRERAVELAYEGHRFNDLRRWLLLAEHPYNIKTSQEFERVGEFNTTNPAENRVANFREETIVTRNFSERHNWMPLKTSDVTIYPEFYQNPGW